MRKYFTARQVSIHCAAMTDRCGRASWVHTIDSQVIVMGILTIIDLLKSDLRVLR